MKKGYIYIINAIVMVMFIISLSGVCTSWKDSYKYPIGFTSNYNQIIIKNEEYGNSLEKVIDNMFSSEESFIIQKNETSSHAFIMFNNYEWNIDIIRGRTFERKDFEDKRSVAVIADVYKNNIYTLNGVDYINVNGCKCEVIGVFKYVENRINSNPYVYVNMTANEYISNNGQLRGEYFIDGNGTIVEFIKSVVTDIKYQRNVFEIAVMDRVELVLASQIIDIKIIVILNVILVMFLILIITLWLSRKKKEIFVRKLCGAMDKDIFFQLLGEFVKIVLISGLCVTIGYCIFAGLNAHFLLILAYLIGLIGISVIIIAIKCRRIRVLEMR
ncbi:MAG: ABC transporter permease [Lachnospiraceae bacterium]|nr:ABC transporter permease [Lachnospiraceae bacterium]